MTTAGITLYLIAGTITGGFVAWEIAKSNARKEENGEPTSPVDVVAAFISCGIVWPLVAAIILIGSAGQALTNLAKRRNPP